jgi:hypothetical protein
MGDELLQKSTKLHTILPTLVFDLQVCYMYVAALHGAGAWVMCCCHNPLLHTDRNSHLHLVVCYMSPYMGQEHGWVMCCCRNLLPTILPTFVFHALQVCYMSPYVGQERGVLLQLGQEQLGHFPLGLWDEDKKNPPPPGL